LSTAITAPHPRLYSLSAQRGASMLPTTEGQRMYHPTLSSAVTRRIWGSPDAILLFFAGGAAEFAAIKAVEWLFFTGRLPEVPVERFFETVRFAQSVFFGEPAGATKTVERINLIHRGVEDARGEEIPQWAYRDMLFILIDYGERAHEVVLGTMTEAERTSHFGVGLALGRAMHLSGLPTTYAEYKDQRHQQLLDG
jgi:ER-bound oxygenase mpaB/B'/Rubber oxygenase, catalytic domain